MKTPASLLSFAVFTGTALATVLQVPYTGGKQSGAVVISTHSGDSHSGQSSPNPDTVRIAGLTVRLYDKIDVALTVCGFKGPTVALFTGAFGTVWQSADTSADWNRFDTIPAGAIAVDSVTGWEGNGGSAPVKRVGQGFALFSAGQRNTCQGAEYFMAPKWNRVVFLRFGSGVDYRAKLSFQSKRDTTFGILPQFQVITSITLNYVINQNAKDLSGPVGLRPEKPKGFAPRHAPKVEYDLYNPLGIRLNRAPGRFEPRLRAPR